MDIPGQDCNFIVWKGFVTFTVQLTEIKNIYLQIMKCMQSSISPWFLNHTTQPILQVQGHFASNPV